jgi:hypothetical protein
MPESGTILKSSGHKTAVPLVAGLITNATDSPVHVVDSFGAIGHGEYGGGVPAMAFQFDQNCAAVFGGQTFCVHVVVAVICVGHQLYQQVMDVLD